jgi:hypothetical protein
MRPGEKVTGRVGKCHKKIAEMDAVLYISVRQNFGVLD